MPITVTRDGPEAIEDAIAATLRTNINAYLDAVWTAYAASDTALGLSIPKVYPRHVVAGRRNLLPQFPVYVVRSMDGATEQDAAPVFGYMRHRFEVIVFCQASKEHTLDVQVKRHLVAIRKLIGTHQQLDGTIPGLLGCHTAHYGKSAVVGHEESMMEQAGAWALEVRVEENYL